MTEKLSDSKRDCRKGIIRDKMILLINYLKPMKNLSKFSLIAFLLLAFQYCENPT